MNTSVPRRIPLVFIVDDEPMVLKAVSKSVASLGCRVSVFGNAFQCLEALQGPKCDLVITDVNMPEMNGVALLKKIKSARPETAVMLITGYGDIPLAVEAVKEGALDFVQKPLNEETFLPKVEALLAEIANQAPLPVTEAELTILRHVASGKSNKEIAYLINRSVRTVENHRHRLMRKLGAGTAADLTRLAIAHGLVPKDSKPGSE